MANQLNLPNAILALTAAILLYAARTDLKQYTISNELILILLALFVVHSVLSERWPSVLSHVGFAFLMLVVTVYFYSQNMMGGGDAKLLTIAFLWAGIDCALAFAVLLLIFATIHALAAKFGWVDTQHFEGEQRTCIPLAPSVAAALISIFIAGCLTPAAGHGSQ